MEINVSDDVIKSMIREEIQKKVNRVFSEEKVDKVLKVIVAEELRNIKWVRDLHVKADEIAKEFQTKELHEAVVNRISADIAEAIASKFPEDY